MPNAFRPSNIASSQSATAYPLYEGRYHQHLICVVFFVILVYLPNSFATPPLDDLHPLGAMALFRTLPSGPSRALAETLLSWPRPELPLVPCRRQNRHCQWNQLGYSGLSSRRGPQHHMADGFRLRA